jgi:hypothetical protein
MYPNAKGSELLAILTTLDPASQAAGTATTEWVSMAMFHDLLAIVQTGSLGTSATVDAKLQQAKDVNGTGAKDVVGKALTQIVKASGENKQALIDFTPDNFDLANGYCFVRLAVTVAVAASQISAQILGINPLYGPADTANQADVIQVL